MNAFAHASAMPASGPQLDNRRVAAGLIDLAIVAGGALAIGLAAGVVGGDGTQIGLPVAAVMTAWALYYYFALESGSGQTLGKKLMRIRVVRVDGSAAGLGDIAVRTVVRVIDMQFVYLVGLVAMLVTGNRRARLGDLAAKTMVVSVDEPSIPLPSAAAVPAVAAVPAPVAVPPVAAPVLAEPAPVLPVAPVVEVEPVAPAPAVPSPEPEPVAPEPEAPPPAVEPVAPEQPAGPSPAVPGPAAREPFGGLVPPAQEEEPQVVVNSAEMVSAIDLVMGEENSAEDDRGDDSSPAVRP